ncbi:MAG: signal peptidase II [Clostridiales bacterium]|nr:signal peptidase II [Clostridiales bacterium]
MQGIRANRWKRIILECIPIILLAISIILDQVSKNFYKELYLKNGQTTVIDGFFYLTYTVNTGAAWSFLSDVSWAQTFFKVLTVLSLILFVFLYVYAVKNKYSWMKYSIAFTVGGTIGNFIDRLSFNGVTDFLSFVFGEYHFPVFNLADSFLVVGVIMLIIHFLFLDDSGLLKKENGKNKV